MFATGIGQQVSYLLLLLITFVLVQIAMLIRWCVVRCYNRKRNVVVSVELQEGLLDDDHEHDPESVSNTTQELVSDEPSPLHDLIEPVDPQYQEQMNEDLNDFAEPTVQQIDKFEEMEIAAKPPSLKSITMSALRYTVSKLRYTFFSRDAYITSVFILLTQIYQGIVGTAFDYFHCVKFGSKSYVYTATDIECYSAGHLRYAPLYGLILAYGYIFPIALFIFFMVFRKRLYVPSFSAKFGSLYNIYKPKLFWYEAYSIARKTVLLTVLKFGPTISQDQRSTTSFVAGIVLLAALIIQVALRPFKENRDNFLEELNLATLITVAWATALKSRSPNDSLAGTITLAVVIIPTLVILLGSALYHNRATGLVLKYVKKIVLYLKVRYVARQARRALPS
jgi:hypothetical protein